MLSGCTFPWVDAGRCNRSRDAFFVSHCACDFCYGSGLCCANDCDETSSSAKTLSGHAGACQYGQILHVLHCGSGSDQKPNLQIQIPTRHYQILTPKISPRVDPWAERIDRLGAENLGTFQALVDVAYRACDRGAEVEVEVGAEAVRLRKAGPYAGPVVDSSP